MAINPISTSTWTSNNTWEDPFTTPSNNVSFKDQVIKGEMVTVNITRDFIRVSTVDPEIEIKHELAVLMAEQLQKLNLIDYTKQPNMVDGTITYRARVFVTPKDQTQVLRTVVK